MSSRKISGVAFLVALLLISLLSFTLSCSPSSNDDTDDGGNWEPDGLIIISRLPLPERDWYYNLDSEIIESQSEFDDFISSIQQIDDWSSNKTEVLERANEWQMDFSVYNLIIYKHGEASGGTPVYVGEPQIEGSGVTIPILRGRDGFTMLAANYGYAYKVGKPVTSVKFVADGHIYACFQLDEGVIVED
ncbi:hypothetical protein ACFLVR_04195 [Chloroflexota bacterium]